MSEKKIDIPVEEPIPQEKHSEKKQIQNVQAPKKTEVEIELNGKWVTPDNTCFGIDVTGVRVNTSETRVKTKNGWFTESDPAKAPVIMIETADKNIRLSAHVKGGSWLPLENGKTGCNLPIDSLIFTV